MAWLRLIPRLLVGTIAGAVLAPAAVMALMMFLGVVQGLCWGPGENDSCLVSVLAPLYILMFVVWIPGAFVGFVVALRWGRARRRAARVAAGASVRK